MRSLLLGISFILSSVVGVAQTLPVEHVIFHTDKDNFNQAENIVISGIITSNASNSLPYSRYLYMELWDREDSLIVSHKLRCDDNGQFNDSLLIPFDAPSGTYYLRGYTRMMANYPLITLPIQTIYLQRNEEDADVDFSRLSCTVYPEGGHAVYDVNQNYAIKLSDANGRTASIPYYVCNEEGDTISSGVTTQNGWQLISVKQQADQRCFIGVDNKDCNHLFELPTPDRYPVITSTPSRQTVVYNIFAKEYDTENLSLCFYHPSIGLETMPMASATGIIQTENLAEGMLSIMLVDNDNNIISQSSQYINPQRTTPDPQVYETDLWSPEPFPLEQSESDSKGQRRDLYAWLCSSVFKRLDLKESLTKGLNFKYKPEEELNISGTVLYRDKHLLKNGHIVAYNFDNGNTTEADIDNNGHFELPLHDFNDGESFFLEAYDKNGYPGIYNYHIENDTLPPMHNWVRERDKYRNTATFTQQDLSIYGLDKENLLPSVIVKGRKKQEQHVPTNKFYSERYLDSNDIERRNIVTFQQLMLQFFNYLQFDIKTGAHSRRGHSSLNTEPGGGASMPFIVDGIKEEVADVINMDPNEIRSIEILAPWQTLAIVGGYGNINGAVVIKTKRYHTEEVTSKGITYTPQGLSNL